ncbi:MAG: hypothetical protein P4L95_03790 [Rouxiella aceris]|uniref:hypothetical protein n=1 Tax=Rouxiella aceris TaxID=2703884 RepID=UPI0028462A24|nr:hypothetical protein [Rouxiella aceris]MDR3431023.1 hypothetical protein [Rouxiella aceris]
MDLGRVNFSLVSCELSKVALPVKSNDVKANAGDNSQYIEERAGEWQAKEKMVMRLVRDIKVWINATKCYSSAGQQQVLAILLLQYNSKIEQLTREVDAISLQLKNSPSSTEKRQYLKERIHKNCALTQLINRRIKIKTYDHHNLDIIGLEHAFIYTSSKFFDLLNEIMACLGRFKAFLATVEIETGFFSGPLNTLIVQMATLKGEWRSMVENSCQSNRTIQQKMPGPYFKKYGSYLQQASGSIDLLYRHSKALNDFKEYNFLCFELSRTKENYHNVRQLRDKSPHLRSLKSKLLKDYLLADAKLVEQNEKWQKNLEEPGLIASLVAKPSYMVSRRGKQLLQC